MGAVSQSVGTRPVLFKVAVPDRTGLGNMLKPFVTALSVNAHTKFQPPALMTGNETVLADEHIFQESDATDFVVEEFWTWRWLILKSEEAAQPSLNNEWPYWLPGDVMNRNLHYYFSETVHIDLHYNRSLIANVVHTRIVGALKRVQLRDVIYKKVDSYMIRRRNTLAVSVRTWTAPHELDVHRAYSFDTYAAAITMMLAKHRQIDTILLSLDNDQHEMIYRDFLAGFDVTVVTMKFETDELSYIQQAAVKMLLLSQCEYFVCSRQSTFAELVFWYSNCTQVVTALM
jgi:hypothetical protein